MRLEQYNLNNNIQTHHTLLPPAPQPEPAADAGAAAAEFMLLLLLLLLPVHGLEPPQPAQEVVGPEATRGGRIS